MAVGPTPVSPETLLEHLVDRPEAACIKCGFCLPTCPTYRETGLESASPRGRIHLMKSVAKGRLPAAEIATQLDLCLGCRACETACPAGVQFGRLLEAGREQTLAARRRSPHTSRLARTVERLFFAGLLPHVKRFDLLVDLLWLYQSSGLQWVVRGSRLLHLLSKTLVDLEWLLPPLPPPSTRRRLATQTPPLGVERHRVGFLAGCVMRSVFAPTNAATVRVLANYGCRVITPRGAGCCGALHAHHGDLTAARQMARRTIEAFASHGFEAVIVNSAGCGAMLKSYGELLEDDPLYREKALAFSERVRDVSEFLAVLSPNVPLSRLPLRVAYDDPCHLLHGQGISREPRQLLRQIPDLELVPFPESDRCCGSAGIYNLTQPAMSQRLLDRKMAHLAAVEPDVIASGNPGCLLQLRWGARRAGLHAQVVHPIELLDRACRGDGR
jgi:glycolate oxidase iron-sulfur subunit